MSILFSLTADVFRELSKIISGNLLTESQIQNITNNIVGKYFAEWLPTPQREAEAEARIDSAKLHISEAAKLVSSLQDDLENQAKQLDLLSKEIEHKKKLADRYETLAKTNQEAFSAFKAEMEETVRKELTAQAEKGKNRRRIASIILWVVTLIIGAALGAYFEISFETLFK